MCIAQAVSRMVSVLQLACFHIPKERYCCCWFPVYLLANTFFLILDRQDYVGCIFVVVKSTKWPYEEVSTMKMGEKSPSRSPTTFACFVYCSYYQYEDTCRTMSGKALWSDQSKKYPNMLHSSVVTMVLGSRLATVGCESRHPAYFTDCSSPRHLHFTF